MFFWLPRPFAALEGKDVLPFLLGSCNTYIWTVSSFSFQKKNPKYPKSYTTDFFSSKVKTMRHNERFLRWQVPGVKHEVHRKALHGHAVSLALGPAWARIGLAPCLVEIGSAPCLSGHDAILIGGLSADMLENQDAHQIWVAGGFQPRNIKTVNCAELMCQGKAEEASTPPL